MAPHRYSHLTQVEDDSGVRDVDDDSKHHKRALQQRMRRQTLVTSLGFFASVVLNLYLVISWIVQGHQENRLLPSPASKALSRTTVVFSSGFGIERTEFQGTPSALSNKRWENLYNFGISRITADEARLMRNKTLPIPHDRGGYVVQLSVFHLLHCLNLVRRGLYGEVDMTNQDESFGIEHLDHCVDQIRQSIMCSADVTPLTFARQSKDDRPKAVAEVIHECHDFEAIQRWALTRQIPADIDFAEVVTDDPLGWGSYIYSPTG
ncbi:hypothetical protein F4805DRAFT_459993 [Annulohypoxylon moriforme]|nr:hypothetical protein F4805DRAFT_459993 [Annulohypoxylon moriforme]